jgi:hypothetical protein
MALPARAIYLRFPNLTGNGLYGSHRISGINDAFGAFCQFLIIYALMLCRNKDNIELP